MLSTSTELSTVASPTTLSPSAPPPVAPPRSLFTPLLYLKRHPWIAMSTFLLLLLVGGYFLRARMVPTYDAESIVYVSPIFPMALEQDHQHDREYEGFMEQQIIAATRADVLKVAIDKYHDYWVQPGESEESALARLEKSLTVEQMGHSYQMSITLKMTQPNGIAEFLNAVTDAYVDLAHRDELYGHDAGVTTLTDDRKQILTDLDADIQKQDAVLRQLGIAKFDPNAPNPYDTEIQKLSDQLSEAHVQRTLDDSKNSAPASFDDAAAAQVETDPSVSAITTQLYARRAVLMLQTNGLTADSALRKQSEAEVASIDRQVADVKSKAATRIANEMQQKYGMASKQSRDVESRLQADLRAKRADAAHAAPLLQQAQQLSAEIQRLQASYTSVQSRMNQLSLESTSPGSEHVVSRAVTPTAPNANHTRLYWAALTLFSLVCAFGAAMLAEMFDPIIYTSGDIVRLIGFPPIGMLLDDRDFSSMMRSEYLIRLAAGIELAYRRTAARTFVFTSAGTGSTGELVQVLGVELAKSGLRTLVILIGDSLLTESQAVANVPKAGLQRTASKLHDDFFSMHDADVNASLFQVVTRPAEGLPAFLRRASTAYTTILIGADPVLLSAHTEHLVRTVDGTVLVTESGVTTKKQLVRVAKLLERLKISGVAVVLSQIRKRHADNEIRQNIAEYAQRIPVQS